MLLYCLRCKTKRESKDPKVVDTKDMKKNASTKMCSP